MAGCFHTELTSIVRCFAKLLSFPLNLNSWQDQKNKKNIAVKPTRNLTLSGKIRQRLGHYARCGRKLKIQKPFRSSRNFISTAVRPLSFSARDWSSTVVWFRPDPSFGFSDTSQSNLEGPSCALEMVKRLGGPYFFEAESYPQSRLMFFSKIPISFISESPILVLS